jgi:hypothetical protein
MKNLYLTLSVIASLISINTDAIEITGELTHAVSFNMSNYRSGITISYMTLPRRAEGTVDNGDTVLLSSIENEEIIFLIEGLKPNTVCYWYVNGLLMRADTSGLLRFGLDKQTLLTHRHVYWNVYCEIEEAVTLESKNCEFLQLPDGLTKVADGLFLKNDQSLAGREFVVSSDYVDKIIYCWELDGRQHITTKNRFTLPHDANVIKVECMPYNRYHFTGPAWFKSFYTGKLYIPNGNPEIRDVNDEPIDNTSFLVGGGKLTVLDDTYPNDTRLYRYIYRGEEYYTTIKKYYIYEYVPGNVFVEPVGVFFQIIADREIDVFPEYIDYDFYRYRLDDRRLLSGRRNIRFVARNMPGNATSCTWYFQDGQNGKLDLKTQGNEIELTDFLLNGNLYVSVYFDDALTGDGRQPETIPTGLHETDRQNIAVYKSTDNRLIIDTPFEERILIYDISGVVINSLNKPAGKVEINQTRGGKILIIKGSSGWSRKMS